MDVPINYLAVLISALGAVVLGGLWFGPLFGKVWMKEAGFTSADAEKAKADPEIQKAMMKSYLLVAVGALVSAFVMAHVLIFATDYLNTSGVGAGLVVAFWTWVGFTAPALMGSVLWEGKTWKYWAIVAGYYLVSFSLMSVLFTLWV